MSDAFLRDERLFDLLTKQATEGVTSSEKSELDRLLASDEGALPSHPQAQELMRRAIKTVPALRNVDVEAVRIATRPIPKDSYSAVGPVPGLSGYYAVVSHSGVTLGAFLGEVVADELVHGRERNELAEFRPSRFFN